MFVIIWRFTTADAEAFERHYGPEGTWARFFRRDPQFVRTDLLRGDAYMTLDWWTSREAYDRFRVAHAAEYGQIDFMCEAVALTEEKVGTFDVVA
jgi:hypothetical protein